VRTVTENRPKAIESAWANRTAADRSGPKRLPRRGAGFRIRVTTRIRHEIWVKILGNVAFNPISALTGATLEEMVRHADVARLVREVMAETEAVAAKLDIEVPISIDQRIAGAEKMGAHKTSMLQDYEAGRAMEIEAAVGAVVELGERLGVSMPATKAVYACTKLLDERRQQRAVPTVEKAIR
jgi:2-dehydropantoate 2-reductase